MVDVGEIVFNAKYGNWISVKKMAIDSEDKPAEVVYKLSSINDVINKKGFEFSGVKTDVIDAFVADLTKGKRTGYANLAEVFGALKPSEVDEKLKQAVSEEIILPLARAYFVRRIVESLGYPVIPSCELLQKIYPGLKFPKPKGNFGGKKKKQ